MHHKSTLKNKNVVGQVCVIFTRSKLAVCNGSRLIYRLWFQMTELLNLPKDLELSSCSGREFVDLPSLFSSIEES